MKITVWGEKKKKIWQGKGKRYCSCHKWMMCYEHGHIYENKAFACTPHHPLENPAFFVALQCWWCKQLKKKRQKTERQHYNEWKTALNPLTLQIETLWRNKCSVTREQLPKELKTWWSLQTYIYEKQKWGGGEQEHWHLSSTTPH